MNNSEANIIILFKTAHIYSKKNVQHTRLY